MPTPVNIPPEAVMEGYKQGFRGNTDWKPGRVSQPYREHYDEIFRKKEGDKDEIFIENKKNL